MILCLPDPDISFAWPLCVDHCRKVASAVDRCKDTERFLRYSRLFTTDLLCARISEVR